MSAITTADYLAQHGVDVLLRDVVQQVLTSRSDQPLLMISKYFSAAAAREPEPQVPGHDAERRRETEDVAVRHGARDDAVFQYRARHLGTDLEARIEERFGFFVRDPTLARRILGVTSPPPPPSRESSASTEGSSASTAGSSASTPAKSANTRAT